MNPGSRLPVLLSILVAGLAPATLPAQRSCSPVNVLVDGGFEQAAGAPPVCPDWVGTSARFGSPVCSVAVGSAPAARSATAMRRRP